MSRDLLRSLPFELWLFTTSFIPPHDLAQLALTSSYNLTNIRPILYRSVNLAVGCFEYKDVSPTFALLARDKELAKCVVELTLCRSFQAGVPTSAVGISLINEDALLNLTHLRHITLQGAVFLNGREQETFANLMCFQQHFHNRLEELSYHVGHDNQRLPSDRFEIHGLKKITWDGYCDHPLTAAWSLFSSCWNTLQTLHLICAETDEVTPVCLWEMYFPELRSLHLGMVEFSSMGNGRDLTDFVLAHGNNLLDLNTEMLCYDFGDDEGSTRLSRDSFPCLRSFKGHSTTLSIMVQVHMSCLTTTLRRLCIGIGEEDFGRIIERILSDNYYRDHPLVLTELETDALLRVGPAGDVIRNCGICFGASLEVWTGFLDIEDMDARDLAELFAPFVRLRVLHLCWLGLDRVGDYVRPLAASCLTLQYVIVRSVSITRGELWEIARPLTPEGEIRFQVTLVDIPDDSYFECCWSP